MKTYEEMAHSALKRIEQNKAEQKKHRKAIAGIAVPAVSLCLAAVIGFGVWKSGNFPKMPEIVDIGESAEDTVIPGLPDTIDMPEQNKNDTSDNNNSVKTDAPSNTTTAVAATTAKNVQQTTTIQSHPVSDDQPGTTAAAAENEQQTTTVQSHPVSDNQLSTTAAATSATASVQQTTTVQPHSEADDKPTTPKIITGDSGGKGPATSSESALFWWKNKLTMTGTLKYAIENNPGCEYAVLATYRPATANITSFTYEGKTLSDLAIEADNERILPDRMMLLLKHGDDLKYGTALYETGNSDGIKWDKKLYEQAVAYIGEELLGKYIVDSVFLREELEKDIAALPSMNVTTPSGSTTVTYNSEETAGKKYAEAYNAYLETVLPSAMKCLSENGIQCERYAYGNSCLKLLVTEEQLENLPLDDLNDWSFDLWSDNLKDDSGVPTVYNAVVN